MRSLFAAVLLLAAPSWAALTSRPALDESPRANMEGLYAGLGGGGALLFVEDSHAFGYDAELRLGYSFNPGLQIYLSGAVDGGSFDLAGGGTTSFRSEMFAAFVQYHLFANGTVGVYGRAGIGIALGGDTSAATAGLGFATGGGLGVEIRIAPGLFLTPELFYKNMSLSVNGGGTSTEQVVGLQLALIYY